MSRSPTAHAVKSACAPRRVSRLPLAAALLAGYVSALEDPATARANHDVDAPLEHVLVTVPIHKKAAETALPVTVLTGDELQRQAALSLGATLERQPGIASASFGPAVGQPVIRGQTGPRVRVLQNGVTSADASVTSADHAIAVEPLLADSVEVLRGPATLLYGGGAIGGVVNVIDGRIPRSIPAQPLSGGVELRHDSVSDGETAVLRLDGGAGQLAWHLSGVYRDWGDTEIPGAAFNRRTVDDMDESSRGFIANSGGRNHAVTAGLSWVGERGYLGVALSDLQSRYGIPRGGHLHDDDQEDDHGGHGHEQGDPGHDEIDYDDHAVHGHDDILIDMQQRRADVKGTWHLHGGLFDVVRGQLSHTDYEHRELEGSGVVATVFDNQTWESRVEAVHNPLAGWHGVIGVQWRDTDFAARGEESFIPVSQTRALGLFLLEDYHAGDWTYELGLRLDRERIETAVAGEERFNSVSGSAAALWNFAPAWQLGLAGSVAERAPTVEELYSNFGNAERHDDHFHYHDPVVHAASRSVEVGDSDLDQERSRNVDLSLRYGAAGVRGEATLFYNDFRDFIWLADSGFSYGDVAVREYRQEDARFHGLELSLTLPVWQGGAGSLEATLYGDHVRGRLDSGGDVPRMPPWRAGIRLDYARGPLAIRLDLLRAADQERPGRHESDSEGYHRLDIGASHELVLANADVTLYLQGRNLTDEEIRTSTSLLRDFAPEPGRSLEAGLRLRF